MGASSQGGQMNPQGAQIRPQGQQQSPMGGQGKGPGLPMPQQGGNRPFQSQPYQPVGVNNPPFNPNPVQPTPGNMPVGMGQAKGAGQGQMTPQMMDQMKAMFQGQAQPQVMPQQGFGQQLSDGTYANQMPLDTSRQAYDRMMAQTSFTPGGMPSYEQFVQQRTAPQMPQSLPQKPMYPGMGYPAPQPMQGTPMKDQNPQVAQMLQQGNMQGAMELQRQLAAQNGKAIQMPPSGYSPMQQQVMPINPMMQRQPMQGQPMAGGKGPMR